MYAAGYYKTNYRALRFRELRRMHGMPKAIRSYWLTRFMPPMVAGWMPGTWADTECKPEDLSENFWRDARPHCEKFKKLGFKQCRLVKITKSLNPLVQETGGVSYLDASGRHFGQVLYTRIYARAKRETRTRIVIAFTAVFDRGTFSCSNHKNAFDPPDDDEVIRLDSDDINFIYQEFLRYLQERQQTPRQFPDVESLRKWFDGWQTRRFEERVRRRLFLPMSEEEVAAAKTRLNTAFAAFPAPARPKIRRWLWLVIVAAVVCLQFMGQKDGSSYSGRRSADTLEYRGQEFKMRKAYATYEDYKDDPDNLDTNELVRIEQAMVSAPVPASFENRQEFGHFLFKLKFPGYGLSGGPAQSDDGSKLEMDAVEIPQRDKKRYLVVRESGGRMVLVDDFLYGTATNAIANVKLEQQKLRYYDKTGQLLREKQL